MDTQVTPGAPHQGGLDFDITMAPLPNGLVKFHVVVSGKGAIFSGNEETTLSNVEIKEDFQSVSTVRILSHERKSGSITCSFSVTNASLKDPNLCFVFSRIGQMSGQSFYASLKDFANPRPPVAPAAPGVQYIPLLDTEVVHVSKLAELGMQWDRQERSARTSESRFDAAALAKAKPSLRALGCKKLEIAYLNDLNDADALEGLADLTSLSFSFCTNLQNIDGLKGLTALTSLDLSSGLPR